MEATMGKSTHEMIQAFGERVGAAAGESTRREVMAGSERLGKKSSPEEVALWVKGAIHRLDEQAGAETGARIMQSCGESCARVNRVVVERARARRLKFANEAEFLAAELRRPPAGTRLELEGEVLYQVYTPQAFTRPMRCYCGLLRGLPAGEQVSPTYCNCSRAFVKALWEGALGRPVSVELLASAVTGSSECRFRIQL
jgi:hypothetical protein